MPDNLVAAMTEDDLIDLVAYLFTLKTASLTPEAGTSSAHSTTPDDKGLDAVLRAGEGQDDRLDCSLQGKEAAR